MRYLAILKALATHHVRFVIVGGVAVVLHGVPRTTYDLDLLVDLERTNALALVDALTGLGFRPRAPVAARDLADPDLRAQWIAQKHMKAFAFWHERLGEVDILLDAPLDYAAVAQDRLLLEAEGTPVPVASIAALLRLKTAAGREQDLSDIEALERVRGLDEEPPST